MNKYKKILISLSLTATLVLLLQFFYVFVLPKIISINEKISYIENFVNERTKISIKIDNPEIKTFFDFTVEFKADKVELNSSDNKRLIYGDNISVKIQPLTLLLKQISVKNLEIKNLFVKLTRYDENIIGLSDKLKFNVNGKSNLKISNTNIHIDNYNILLDDRFVYKKLTFSGKNIDVTSLNRNISEILASGKLNIDKNISEYDVKLTADFSDTKHFAENCLIDGYIKNISLKPFEIYMKSSPDINTTEGIINLAFNTERKNKKTNLINLAADFNDIAINKGNYEKQLILKNENKLSAGINFEKNRINIGKLTFSGDDYKIISAGKIENYTEKEPQIDIAANIPYSKAETVVNMLPYGICEEINLIKRYGISGDVSGSLIIRGNSQEPDVFGKINSVNVHALRNREKTHSGTLNLEFFGKKANIFLDLITETKQTFDMTGTIDIYDKDWSTFKVKTSDKIELPLVKDILVPVSEIFRFLVVPLPFTEIKSGVGNAVLDIKGMQQKAYINGKVNLHNITGKFDGIDALLTNVNVVLDFQNDKLNFKASDFRVNSYPAALNGQCDLIKGTFDFTLNSDNIAASLLKEIVNKSEWLSDVRNQMKQISSVSGFTDFKLNVAGIIDENFDISKIDLNAFKINGLLNLKNNRIKLSTFANFIERVSGKINFSNNGISFNNVNFGLGKYSNGKADGKLKITPDNNSIMEISVKSPNMNSSETLNFALNSDYAVNNGIKTFNFKDFESKHSLEFSGIIKNDDIDLKSVSAKIDFFGKINDKNKNYISGGEIEVKNNAAHIRRLNINADKSNMVINGIISNINLKKPSCNLRVISKNFSVNSAAEFVKSGIFGRIPADYAKSFKGYHGAFDADIEITNKGLLGQLIFHNFGFRHIKSDIPALFPKIDIKLTNSKIVLNKITGELGITGKIPVFIDVVINNYMKIPYIQGKIMGRLNQTFVERYLNIKMQQPVKLNGNIDISAEINGSADSLRVTSDAMLQTDSDISYMSANLGDTDYLREFILDAYITPMNINLKNFEYKKHINLMNSKIQPVLMFAANGNFSRKDLIPKNFSFETKQNLSAKLLNCIFRKSLIKNGTFNASVKYSAPQTYSQGKISGTVNINDAEIPLYGALIKNAAIKTDNGNNINIVSSGSLIKTDYSLQANIQNSLQLPVKVNNFVLHTKYLNLDNCLKTINKWSIDSYLNTPRHTKVPFNISDIIVNKGNLKVDLIEFKSVPMINLNSQISLDRNSNLKIKVNDFTMAEGKVFSDINYDIKNAKAQINLKAENVDSNIIAEAFLGLKNQIKGKFSGSVNLSTKGFDSVEQLNNLNGNADFSINDGKMPKLGSLEYLLHASNLIKSGLTALSVNGVIELLNPFKEGSFEKISGSFDIKKGIIENLEILSQGSHLSIYMNGKYDIAENNSEMNVYGKFGRKIDGLLGGVGNLSLNTFFNMIPISKESEEFDSEISKIPDVTYKSDDYRVFRADIEGNINENNAVKSFKWLK